MRALVLALALLPGAALAEDAAAPAKPSLSVTPAPAPKRLADKQCANARVQHAKPDDKLITARPLTEEPKANRYLPVMRMVDGCELPMMIGEHKEGGR